MSTTDMVTCVWRFSPFVLFSFLVCNRVFFPASTPTRLLRQPGYHATCVYILSRLSRHYPAFTPQPGFHAAIPVSTPPRAFTLDHNKVEDSLPRLRIVFLYFSTCDLFRRTNHYPPTGPAPGHTTTQPFHTLAFTIRSLAVVPTCAHEWRRQKSSAARGARRPGRRGRC